MRNENIRKLRDLDAKLDVATKLSNIQDDHLFDMIPAAVLLEDLDGRVLRANRSAAELLGFEHSGMLEGKAAEELFPDYTLRAALNAQVIQTGVPMRGVLHAVRKSGEIRQLLTDRVPHHDEEGRVDGVLVFSVDVTDVVQP